MARLLKRFTSDRRGATAVEYGLLLACITIAMALGFAAVGGTVNNTAMTVSDHVAHAR